MMDTPRLYQLLADTTMMLRKGEVVKREHTGPIEVITVDAMPSVEEIGTRADAKLIDLHFVNVVVYMDEARKIRNELVEMLKTWPSNRLAAGPSYIEVGAVLGDQGAAFCLFALGEALDLWTVITPEKLGMKDDVAARAAGVGYIMISGFKDVAGLPTEQSA